MSEFDEESLLINDNELKAEEALDAIESVSRNTYFQNSQPALHAMPGDGMHNIISLSQRMEPVSEMGPTMLDYSMVLPNPKKSKKDYPWLEVVGEPCYSERQEASGMDLTNVKKKYRKMLCLYCARYNPTTPWSVLKSRKFEADGFAEHEKSTHHIRSLQIRDFPDSSGGLVNREQLAYPTINMVQMMPSLHPMNYEQAQMQHQAQVQVQEDGEESDGSSVEDGNNSYNKDVNHQQMLAMQIQQQQHQLLQQHQQQAAVYQQQQQYQQLQMHGAALQQAQQVQSQSQQQQGQSHQGHGNPLLSVHTGKTKQSPDWLRIDSKLSFSDRQIMSGKDLSGMKKKYKKVYCQYCHDFNPSSPWAISKARKYEASVLCEHDRSHNHKKAVALREAAMNGGVYQHMIMKPLVMNKDPPLQVQQLQTHLVENVVPVHVGSGGVLLAGTLQAVSSVQQQQQQPQQATGHPQPHQLMTHMPAMAAPQQQQQQGGSGMDPNSHNLMMQFQQQQMQLKMQHQQQQQIAHQMQAQNYQHHLLQQQHLQHQLQQQYASHEQQIQLQNQLKMQHQMHLLQHQQQQAQKMVVAGQVPAPQQQQQMVSPPTSQSVPMQQPQQQQSVPQHLSINSVQSQQIQQASSQPLPLPQSD